MINPDKPWLVASPLSNPNTPMKQNAGTIDRALRILIGIGLLTAAAITRNPWFLAGLVPLLTGLVGFCPMYCPLGINTKGKGGSCGCGSGGCGK